MRPAIGQWWSCWCSIWNSTERRHPGTPL